MNVTRADFAKLAVAAAASAPSNMPTDASHGHGLTIAHFSDVHVKDAPLQQRGVRAAFERINAAGVDFALGSGDLLFDVLDANEAQAERLMAAYRRALATLRVPVYHAMGNHDNAGIYATSGFSLADARYGKGLFEAAFGPRYYSFDARGWHVIVLDSTTIEGRNWSGLIDDVQIAWLRADLGRVARATPLVVALHVPLMTSVISVMPDFLHLKGDSAQFRVPNAGAVLDLLWSYNLKVVLQGHSHLPERIEFNGTQFITSGAVSGAWWRGPFLGNPPGFGVVRLASGRVDWRYVPSGFDERETADLGPPCGCLAGALWRAYGARTI